MKRRAFLCTAAAIPVIGAASALAVSHAAEQATQRVYVPMTNQIDASRIAYVIAYLDSTSAIWMNYGSGGDPVMLVPPDQSWASNPAWSPDGAQLAFSFGPSDVSSAALTVMRADGTGLRRSTPSQKGVLDYDPAWSPDGNRIAFASNRTGKYQLCLLDISSGNVTRLRESESNDFSPTWSPDGQHIAFSAEQNGTSSIFRMQADGSSVQQLSNSAQSSTQPAWSPDGTRIAFVSYVQWPEGGLLSRIFVMNADGSGQKQLAIGEALENDNSPAWSPDSKRIVYSVSIPIRQERLQIINADGSTPPQVFALGGSSPTWTR